MKITVCLSCALSLTFLTILSTCQGQRFLSTPSDMYYVTRGQPASVTCEAQNVNTISFSCSKDLPGNRLTVLGKVSDSGDETIMGTLMVLKEDIRGYSSNSPFWCECVGETDSGTPIRSRRSEIKSAFLKREFLRFPESKSSPIGSKVEFLCSPPAGQPIPKITWQRDGKKINIAKDKNLLVNERGMLIIQSLRKKDLGSYVCVARNTAAKRYSAAALLTVGDASVEERLDASDSPLARGPIYDKEPAALLYVTEDESIDMSCKVIGAQILTVRCNNRRLVDDEQRKVESDTAQGKVFETTWAVSKGDVDRYSIDGLYACYCVSWYTLPGASGWLNKTSEKGFVEVAYMEEVFSKEPTSQTVGTGSTVTLDCTAPKSKPPAVVTWFYNDNPLDTNRRSMSVDKAGALTISGISQREAGDYKCTAANAAGVRFSSTGRLTVQDGFVEEEEVEPEVVNNQPGEAYFSTPFEKFYYMVENQPVTVTCGVKNADMITIRCNGRRYDNDEITKKDEYNRDIGKFNIDSSIQVTAQDVRDANGAYACICTMWYTVSGNWEREESIEANIVPAFIEEVFTAEPIDTQAEAGVSTQLNCAGPKGGPVPEITWLKDGSEFDVSRDRNTKITKSGSLSINSMRRRYEGTYTCVATNTAGVLYSRQARLSLLDTATDPITESILIDGASTAEPDEYTPYTEPEVTDTGVGVAHSALPMFVEEPESIYYLVKGQFITITCSAKNVLSIAFRCSGYDVPSYRLTNNDVSSNDMVSVSLELSQEDIEGFTDDNSCVCDARYKKVGFHEESKIASSPGFINMAYIRKRFEKNPESTSTMEGMMAALPCTPPQALPRPTVYWLFNGQRLDSRLGSNIVQPDDNSLVFVNPTSDLQGDYTCVAENVAGRRTSNTARLTVEAPDGRVVVDPEVDHSYPETTSEPEGEGEAEAEAEAETTSEPESEPDAEEEYYTTWSHHVHHEGGAMPETTLEYTTSDYRGNEIDMETGESDITPEPKEDLGKSFTMVTDDSDSAIEVATDSVDIVPLTTESIDEIEPMATDSMEIKPMATDSMEIKPLTTATPEIKPMVTDNLAIDTMVTDTMTTESMSNEIDQMGLTTKPRKTDKKGKKGSKRPKPASNKKFKKCQEKMSLCSRYFTEHVRPAEERGDDELLCQSANEYIMCVQEFLGKCEDQYKDDQLDVIKMTRNRYSDMCSYSEENVVVDTNMGPYEECRELQTCTRHLTEGDTFNDAYSACNSLTSMLMCGDSAVSKCNIDNNAETDTSLADIGEWYSNFCSKVITERTSFVQCESVRQCNNPFNASTSIRDMYDVNVWCSYTHSQVHCTMNALDSCQPEDRESIEADLNRLKSQALVICPQAATGEEVIDVGETLNPGNPDSGSSSVQSTAAIVLSFVHVVFLFVLSLR